MMLTERQAAKILEGNHTFTLWSLSMLITRLKGVYAKNPTDVILGNCTIELNTFVKKYSNIMGGDVAVIQNL